MTMSTQTPARKLFDLLVSRDFDPEMLDVSGKPAPDPAEAEIFSFDFRAQSGKDYGTVVIMLSNEGDLEVYCADNVGKTMEGPDKDEWFQFLEQLKNFAVRNNRMNFGIKNLNHLRYSMQGQAAIKEGLFESWSGKKDVSYNAGPNESRLMIKHKRSLGEGEARFRYVESLFIETAEGERYKLPFKNLTAGKAMLEHVRTGGRPYDMRGQHIAEMVSELTVLSRFRRANTGKLLEGDTAQLVEQTNAYYENLQRNLKSLTSRRGYDTYFESWAPAEVSEESVVIEGLKHLFVTQSIDQRIEDALPLIAKIQQQENAMKEANIFEAWANNLMEGTWQTPDTPEKQAKLLELMSQDLPVGADATNATEQLYDVLGDDVLFDQLEELAERDANADARQVIYDRMQELSNDPNIRKVMDQFQVDADVEMNPPEATPADLEEDELEDDGTLGGDASDELIRSIEIKEPEHSMEESDNNDLAGILRIAGVPAQERPAPDYEEEVTDEGILGTVGGAMGGGMLGSMLGGAVGGPIGALAGAGIGQAAGAVGGQELTKGGSSLIEKDGKEETDEGIVDTIKGLAGIKSEPPTRDYAGVTGNFNRTVAQHSMPATSTADLSKTLDTAVSPTMPGFSNSMIEDGMDEGELGTAIGAGLGGAVGGIPGAALGGIAGHYLTKDDDKKQTKEGWKGQLAGGTVGTLAGGALGAAGGPIGSMIGGALGGTAGQMIGDKLGGNEEDEKEETEEGKLGALAGGAVGGYATKSVKGAVSGAKIGSALQDRFSSKKGDKSPLAGQYGHSGKMKEVAKDTSFLDRLKELSGMKK